MTGGVRATAAEAPRALDLSPLLEPRSIAVVGATDRPGAYADAVLENLARAGFEGPVWGVNPRRERVHGRPCVPTLADLPEPVDAVVVAIPAAAAPEAVAGAADRGCGGAVVLSAGFGEVESGRELERRLREAAIEGGLPVCGPNGNGIVAVPARAPMWGDSVAPLEPGPVALISQSGNLAVNALGSRRGIRYHTVVSTGNQTTTSAADWLDAVCRLEGVRSVALFLEADGDGASWAQALARCAERGVGVAVLKVGGSEAGAMAASAHTGAIAGDQRIFRGLFEEAGAAWARDPHELLELARALAEPRARPRGDGGLAVLTCSGGDSGVAADEADRLGVSLPKFARATCERLAELLPEAATVGNPLDYTALIWGESDLLRRIIGVVAADPQVDQLLMLYDHPQGLAPHSEASWAGVRDGIVAGAAEVDAGALVASTLPDLIDDQASGELGERGIPAIAGLTTALRCAQSLRADPGDPERLREVAAAAQAASSGADGDSRDGRWLDEIEAKEQLRAAGIPVPDGRETVSESDCVAAAVELGPPVALKLAGPELRHKSEAGALALGLRDEDEVRSAYRRLLSAPAAGGTRVLIERMGPPGVELLVAARTDGVVPALVLGLGGLWTEALDDVAIVPLPADPTRVEHALRGLRGAPTLTGGRGREQLDIAGAARLAAAAGTLALDAGLDLLELNPVVVHRDGCLALDAVAHRSGSSDA